MSLSTEGIGTQGLTNPNSFSADVAIGQSQDRLTKACVGYLKIEMVQSRRPRTSVTLCYATPGPASRVQERTAVESSEQQLSLLNYAASFWFLHAKKAESRGILQTYLAQDFNSSGQAFQRWLGMSTDYHFNSQWAIDRGSKLLHVASVANLCSTVQTLLDTGIYVDERDATGNTSLHLCARSGVDKLLRMLLDRGADIMARNNAQNTALGLAAANRHTETVAMLLRSGADVQESGDALGGVPGRLPLRANCHPLHFSTPTCSC